MTKPAKNLICPECSQTGHKWSKVYYTENSVLKQAYGIYITCCSKTRRHCMVVEKQDGTVKYEILAIQP